MVVHSKIEEFMELLMQELNMEIPKYTLKRWRWFKAQIEETKSGKEILKVSGITEDGTVRMLTYPLPYDIFKQIKIEGKITGVHNLNEA